MEDKGTDKLTTISLTDFKYAIATMKRDDRKKLIQDIKSANGQAGKENVVQTAITANIGDAVVKKAAAAAEATDADITAAEKAAADLGELILKMNPYTNSQIKNTNRSTGEMEIIGANAVEMEGPYAQEWTFKGHPQRVGMAVRIKYRYPVRNEGSETLFWVEDYLLIGFQGSMGG